MNELQLSHSEFTICCSARVPGRCQTREVELMLVTASSQVLLVFFLLLFIPTALDSVFPGHSSQSLREGEAFTDMANFWVKTKSGLKLNPPEKEKKSNTHNLF